MEEVTDGAKSNVGWLEETMDLLHKMASEQRQGETPLERTLNTEAFSWSTLRSTVSAASSVKVGSTWNVQRSSDW